jgi:hypothetical protein
MSVSGRSSGSVASEKSARELVLERTPDIIYTPELKPGCVHVEPGKTVKPGDLKKYYRTAHLKFIYNEPWKGGIRPHHFYFYVGLTKSANDDILLEKPLTYLDLGIMNSEQARHFTAQLHGDGDGNITGEWLMSRIATVLDLYKKHIQNAIKNAIQNDATPDGEKRPKHSEISEHIELEPVICRKHKETLVPLDTSVFDRALAQKNPSFAYKIYFTSKMKPGYEDYTAKRILHAFCMNTPADVRYMTQRPKTFEYISEQENGKPRVYNERAPPFNYSGGRRMTRRVRRAKQTRRRRA